MIKIIATCDKNCGIGKDGKIPWRNVDDMAHFKAETIGKIVVMGRKTWKSLDYKELKGRENVILSREAQPLSMNRKYKNVKMFRTIEFICEHYNNEFVIIGGQQIYEEFLERDLVDYITLTTIKGRYDCDTFFPYIYQNRWQFYSEMELNKDVTILNFARIGGIF